MPEDIPRQYARGRPSELAQVSICRAPADDQQCFCFNEPEDFKSAPGVAVRNCG
jgi:hypothetical protein